MKILKKIANNFLTVEAINVLGLGTYTYFILNCIFQIFNIIKIRDLRPLDKKMGQNSVENFTFSGNKFIFDCHFCDKTIKDGTYAFGVVREIYIRDCYFKYLPKEIFQNINNAVDIGANRGAFSSLMTSTANYILSVEAQKEFEPVIKNNMLKNKFENYDLEIGFIGTGGDLSNKNIKLFTIPGLLDKHNIDQVDLLKMDIEGSEFSLFEDPDWLTRINAICMEVHQEFGDPKQITDVLNNFGFTFKVADENLNLTEDPESVNYIYAWKKNV